MIRVLHSLLQTLSFRLHVALRPSLAITALLLVPDVSYACEPSHDLSGTVESLAHQVLDLESASSETKGRVLDGIWHTGRRLRGGEEHDVFDATLFLNWLRSLKPSPHPSDWALSHTTATGTGSCLGLVLAAVLVGRSIGLDVHSVAVPDHLLLQINSPAGPKLYELLEGAREMDVTEARLHYRVPSVRPSPFLKPLSDREMVASIRIERAAERIEGADLEGAARDARLAIRAFPEHPSGYLNLGLVKLHEERWKRAERLFSSALRANPLDPRAWYNRALARWKLGRKSGSRADIEAALRLNPRMPGAIGLLRALDEK